MAEKYRSPGWYPAPDGTPGERWWNGSGWSDSRRNAEVAPPVISRPNPYAPVPTAPAQFGTNPVPATYDGRNNRLATAGLIAGAISVFGAPIAGPVGLILSILGIVKARQLKAAGQPSSSIVLAAIGLALSLAGTIMMLGGAALLFTFD